MKSKITGMAPQVPTSEMSVLELTVELERETTYEEICAEIERQSEVERLFGLPR